MKEKNYPCGEAHPAAKLTWPQVDLIRASATEIVRGPARQLGVSPATICRVKSHSGWREEDRPNQYAPASCGPRIIQKEEITLMKTFGLATVLVLLLAA